METFSEIYTNYISHDKTCRNLAENFINTILSRCNPEDITYLLDSLVKIENCYTSQTQISSFPDQELTSNLKLFISMILKKIFETCITEENFNIYQSHLSLIKYEIINLILNSIGLINL